MSEMHLFSNNVSLISSTHSFSSPYTRSLPPRLPSKAHRFRIAVIYPFILIPSFHPQAQFMVSPVRLPSSPLRFLREGHNVGKTLLILADFVLKPNKLAAKTSETKILPETWKRDRHARV